MPIVSPERYIRERVRLLPIDCCLISRNWKENGLAVVFVMRRHPKGTVTAGSYLVDTFCRGVCNSHYYFSIEEDELYELIGQYESFGGFDEVRYEEAHNLIFGAIAFAEDVGIKPCKDFALTQYILEDDTDDIPLIEYEYGRDGKYFLCVPSRLEASRYLPALKEHLGDDFDVMIDADDDEEYDDYDEMDDDYDDENLSYPYQDSGMEGEYSYQHKEYKQTEELFHPWLQALLNDPDKPLLSHDEIDKVLALPHDELRHDLKQLALAEMGRNARDEYSDPYNPVISHVFLLLGEVGDSDSLELMLEMMRQPEDFFEYHICDGGSRIVRPAIYKLGKDRVRRLIDFLEEPGLYSFARIEVLEVALCQVFLFEPSRKDELVEYARELAEFILSHKDDPKYMDGSFAGFLCCNIVDIGAAELLPLIERIYATGNADESICGNIKSVRRDIKLNLTGEDPVTLSIYDQYDELKRLFGKK